MGVHGYGGKRRHPGAFGGHGSYSVFEVRLDRRSRLWTGMDTGTSWTVLPHTRRHRRHPINSWQRQQNLIPPSLEGQVAWEPLIALTRESCALINSPIPSARVWSRRGTRSIHDGQARYLVVRLVQIVVMRSVSPRKLSIAANATRLRSREESARVIVT